MKNKFGLARNIPKYVKETVRKRCGFGCVICGNSFITYEHMSPTFAEATEHRAENITLLCAGCHYNAYTTKYIQECDTNPYVQRHPFVGITLQPCKSDIPLRFGSNSIQGSNYTYLSYNSEPMIYFMPPEKNGAPLRLSAKIFNKSKRLVFHILNNELITFYKNLNPDADLIFTRSKEDQKIVGPKILIQSKKEDYKLLIHIKSDECISIEGTLYYGNRKIEIDPTGATRIYTLNKFGELLPGKSTIESCNMGKINIEGTPLPFIGYPKTGRNEPCPCGSLEKYKQCCIIKDTL